MAILRCTLTTGRLMGCHRNSGNPTGKSLRLIRNHVKKYFASVFQKYMIVSPHPASTRGAYRDRHGRWQRDAVDE
jgi:hypothetical protein